MKIGEKAKVREGSSCNLDKFKGNLVELAIVKKVKSFNFNDMITINTLFNL